MKFAFIAAESADDQFDVEFMCNELEVSTSGYYASKKRGICQHKLDDLALVPLIHTEFRKTHAGLR